MPKNKSKKKGPTPKRKPDPIMVRCEGCGTEQKYPHYGDCPKCGNETAVYS